MPASLIQPRTVIVQVCDPSVIISDAGDAGATVLAAAARRCPSLSHLHLQGNSQVSATALKLIATSLSSAKRRRRNSTLGFFDVIPGSSSSSSIAAQAEVHGAGAIESSAAAMDFGTRSRFASVSCEREPETVSRLDVGNVKMNEEIPFLCSSQVRITMSQQAVAWLFCHPHLVSSGA